MFRGIVNRFVPRGLLPRRYNTEQVIRYCIQNNSGKSIDHWVALGNITQPQQRAFFDAMDHRYGDAVNSGEREVMRQALAEVLAELTRYVSDSISESTSEVGEQIQGIFDSAHR